MKYGLVIARELIEKKASLLFNFFTLSTTEFIKVRFLNLSDFNLMQSVKMMKYPSCSFLLKAFLITISECSIQPNYWSLKHPIRVYRSTSLSAACRCVYRSCYLFSSCYYFDLGDYVSLRHYFTSWTVTALVHSYCYHSPPSMKTALASLYLNWKSIVKLLLTGLFLLVLLV